MIVTSNQQYHKEKKEIEQQPKVDDNIREVHDEKLPNESSFDVGYQQSDRFSTSNNKQQLINQSSFDDFTETIADSIIEEAIIKSSVQMPPSDDEESADEVTSHGNKDLEEVKEPTLTEGKRTPIEDQEKPPSSESDRNYKLPEAMTSSIGTETQTSFLKDNNKAVEIETQTSFVKNNVNATQTSFIKNEVNETQTSFIKNDVNETQTSITRNEENETQTSFIRSEVNGTQTSFIRNKVNETQTSITRNEENETQTSFIKNDPNETQTSVTTDDDAVETQTSFPAKEVETQTSFVKIPPLPLQQDDDVFDDVISPLLSHQRKPPMKQLHELSPRNSVIDVSRLPSNRSSSTKSSTETLREESPVDRKPIKETPPPKPPRMHRNISATSSEHSREMTYINDDVTLRNRMMMARTLAPPSSMSPRSISSMARSPR